MEAQERQVEEQSPEQKHQSIESAVTFSRERNLERQAVVDERDLMRDALRRSMGEATSPKCGASSRIACNRVI